MPDAQPAVMTGVDQNGTWLELAVALDPGRAVTIEKIVAVSLDDGAPQDAPAAAARTARLAPPFAALEHEHREAWAGLWKRVRIATYPWRSAGSGEEETPRWQCNPISSHWMTDNTYLQRASGAVTAFDLWSYYLATGDELMLLEWAGEMLIKIARFWASLAQRNADPGRFELCM